MKDKSRQAKTGKKRREQQPLKDSASLPSNPLIFFDKKVKIFLLVLVAIYFFAGIFKFHSSSIATWDVLFGNVEPESVIAGEPRPIRQDEWMVYTPSLVGQYYSGMPVTNATFGAGNVPVIWGWPVKDFSMVLRPALWSYFVLDIERAFAFSWNFVIFGFLISMFLLFMLLTRNNFWLSAFGTIYIFFSSAMQWWSYQMAGQMIWLNSIVMALIYLLYARTKISVILAAVILLFSAYNFIVNLYPPWQVPLFYLYLLIFLGYIFQGKDFKIIIEKKWLRLGAFLGASFVLAVFLYHYYGLVKDTYQMMMNTAYPGKRTTNGGDLIAGKLFSEFFGIYMTDAHAPRKWWNVCEASNFIMFFPMLFYGIGYYYFKAKRINWLQAMLCIYIIILLVWLLIGFPGFLSRVSLFSMSPVYRSLPILGLANCILLIIYLGDRSNEVKNKFSWIEFLILTTGVFVFVKVVSDRINEATNNFFQPNEIMVVCILISVAYLLIRYKHVRFTQPALALILLGMNFQNFKVHPLMQGLSSLTDNPLVIASKEIQEKDPSARWAVFGNVRLTNLLKVNGINVFNGVKVVPILKDMTVLDSSGKNSFIYNRYAHIAMTSYINWKDTIGFKLNENEVVSDSYSILVDPCSPKLGLLGINYFLFSYKPAEPEIRCLVLVKNISGLYIYKHKER